MTSMKDIGNRLGVSAMTVQRALKGDKRVRPELAKKIRDLAHELRYEPNLLVKGVLQNKSQTVGIILPNIQRFHAGRILHHAIAVLRENNYRPLVLETHGDVEIEMDEIRQAAMRRVEGLLLMASPLSKEAGHFDELITRKIPVVLINRPNEDLPFETFSGDNEHCSEVITQKLIDLGHKTMAHLAVVRDDPNPGDTLRKVGWEKALKNNGIDPKSQRSFDMKTQDDEKTYKTVAKWIKEKNPPTAIFCDNSFNAITVYRAIMDAGLTVGKEISVVSPLGDPIFSLERALIPKIAGYREPGDKIGVESAKRLVEILEHNKGKTYEPQANLTMYKGEWIDGPSLGPPPA